MSKLSEETRRAVLNQSIMNEATIDYWYQFDLSLESDYDLETVKNQG